MYIDPIYWKKKMLFICKLLNNLVIDLANWPKMNYFDLINRWTIPELYKVRYANLQQKNLILWAKMTVIICSFPTSTLLLAVLVLEVDYHISVWKVRHTLLKISLYTDPEESSCLLIDCGTIKLRNYLDLISQGTIEMHNTEFPTLESIAYYHPDVKPAYIPKKLLFQREYSKYFRKK